MLISLKNKNKDVILISLPYTELLNLNESIILSMNKIIENLKEKYMCKYIDIYSIQKEEKLKGYTLTLDGVHFNKLSAKLLGKCVNEILSK